MTQASALFKAVTCPECEWIFQIEAPLLGEVIPCPDCGLNLKVTALTDNGGVSLELTETAAEDWGQ